MTATKRLNEVPGFQPRWRLEVNGVEIKGDWEIVSPFGTIHTAVVMHSDGAPNFDRPLYREAENVNTVVWGRGTDGIPRFAVVRQERPHADDPEVVGNNHAPVLFGGVPMGFLERLIGKDLLLRHESPEHGAMREAGEEAGASVVLNVERPAYPYHNPNPTFVGTWSNLVFVEVDLAKVQELVHDRNEPIFSAEYVTADELRRRIALGKDERGAVYRACTSNSIWMIFFATHPELW